MRTYIFCNHIYCKRCGFTNKNFVRVWRIFKGIEKYTILKQCQECFLDLMKIRNKISRSKEGAKEKKRLRRLKNIDRAREQDKIAQKKRYYKKKKQLQIQENRYLQIGKELK